MKKVLSTILSFVLFLLVFFLGFIVILKMTFLSEKFMRSQIINSSYSENLMEDLELTLNSYSVASGFQKDIIRPVLTIERIKTDTYREISFLYRTDDKRADVESFKTDINELFLKDLESRNIKLNDDVKSSILELSNLCATAYSERINFPFISQLSNFIEKISKMINLVMYIIIGLILVDMTVIFFINKILLRKLRYYIYAFSASGLMFLSIYLLFLFTNRIRNIGISSKSLYNLVVFYSEDILQLVFKTSLSLFGVTLIFIIMRIIIQNQNKLNQKSS